MKFFLCLLAAVCSLCLLILFCSVGVCFLSGFGPMTSWLRKTRLRQTPAPTSPSRHCFKMSPPVPTPTSPSRHCFLNVTLSANSDPSESALFSKFHPQRFKMSPSVPTPTRPSRHCFQNFTPCANSSQSELVLEVKF